MGKFIYGGSLYFCWGDVSQSLGVGCVSSIETAHLINDLNCVSHWLFFFSSFVLAFCLSVRAFVTVLISIDSLSPQ